MLARKSWMFSSFGSTRYSWTLSSILLALLLKRFAKERRLIGGRTRWSSTTEGIFLQEISCTWSHINILDPNDEDPSSNNQTECWGALTTRVIPNSQMLARVIVCRFLGVLVIQIPTRISHDKGLVEQLSIHFAIFTYHYIDADRLDPACSKNEVLFIPSIQCFGFSVWDLSKSSSVIHYNEKF